ncbi:MAG: hypothetical protein ACK4F7_08175 [Inhella sp.]
MTLTIATPAALQALQPTEQADDWIAVADGAELDMHQPGPGMLTPYAIGHSLAQLNRFTGHAARPYSVAEHSLLVLEILEREHGVTPANAQGVELLLAGLTHDAHEAVTGDLHTPGKRCVGPGWRAWEGHWERLVRAQFGTAEASRLNQALIKLADLQALATERRDLLPSTLRPWNCLQGIAPIGWVNLAAPERCAMGWLDWRDRWLDELGSLEAAREALQEGQA